MGVISLLGHRQQELISKRVFDELGPEEIQRRNLVFGGPYDFQGDERDVIFLSMVVAPAIEGRRPKPAQTSEAAKRLFNVAASRARDQLWLFHSVTLNDLRNPEDVRRRLLEYCLGPHVESIAFDLPEDAYSELAAPFESLFEQQVFRHIRQRGYRVLPQVKVGSYRIDLVVEGLRGRLAVECDGDQWHGPEQYEYDSARQRQLERAGWTFWRVAGSDFYLNPEQALSGLWEELERLGIHPNMHSAQEGSLATLHAEPSIELPYPAHHSSERRSDGETIIENSCDSSSKQFANVVQKIRVVEDTDSVEHWNSELIDEVADPIDQEVVEIIASTGDHPHSHPGKQDEADEIVSAPVQTSLEFEVQEILAALDKSDDSAAAETEYADVARSFMIPYHHWTFRTLQDPFDRPNRELVEEMLEIIEAEGPILCRRVFGLFAEAAGYENERHVRSVLNSVLYNAYSNHRIEYANEWGKPGQIDDILRVPGRSRVRLREGGGRAIHELPPSEVAELIGIVEDELGIVGRNRDYAVFDGVLRAYEIDVSQTDRRRAELWEVVKKRLQSL